jgi:hypothetical protein
VVVGGAVVVVLGTVVVCGIVSGAVTPLVGPDDVV